MPNSLITSRIKGWTVLAGTFAIHNEGEQLKNRFFSHALSSLSHIHFLIISKLSENSPLRKVILLLKLGVERSRSSKELNISKLSFKLADHVHLPSWWCEWFPSSCSFSFQISKKRQSYSLYYLPLYFLKWRPFSPSSTANAWYCYPKMKYTPDFDTDGGKKDIIEDGHLRCPGFDHWLRMQCFSGHPERPAVYKFHFQGLSFSMVKKSQEAA